MESSREELSGPRGNRRRPEYSVPPPSPSLETPLAEHEEEDLESDVDAEGDAEDRAPTQRLPLSSRVPFSKR